LLPFAPDQVRQYLLNELGSEERATAAMQLLDEVHDLAELGSRPVLLHRMTKHLAELEAFRARGEAVNAARVYDVLTEAWFDRDDGKHTFSPRDKRELMERLAAQLWRSGERSWSADGLEDWLDTELRTDERLRELYGRSHAERLRELLREDLRTSSF